MIEFDNTEIAFRNKSNYDLRKSFLLFSALSRNWLMKLGVGLTQSFMRIGLPVNWFVKPTIYKQFVGGETITDSIPVVEMLGKYNVKAILDYSVEGSDSKEGIQNALEETLRSIKNAANHSNIPFAVFKPTAFTTSTVLLKVSAGDELTANEKEEADNFRKRVDKLCSAAFEKGIPILIDAEDSWYQSFIDDVVNDMMAKYNKERTIVFNTFQMYRHDRLDYLKKSFQMALEGNYFLGAKFVRGAYMEKERERAAQLGYPSPIQPDKEHTDNDYNAALKFCIEHIDRITIFNGTHNEYSSGYLTELMAEAKIAKDDPRVWFSQLYGMSDHISFNLAHNGYNVVKYLPYGPVKYVIPYLVRRAEENTSVKGQTGRELSLIKKEIKRRKR
ncbi:MAG TPA: proline dehydrogenase family protein [Bacteroidales bacterium]|nr:MAG: Proline dehydrogenase 1 [Bacteroidetes bacterium ADurb.Bin041]HNV49592.1 proline dehydrogenase family protein [Bacteroidales bacterium]HPW42777.1 proline dehydrogenase family protein [Bacteroidales bacterium]